MGIKAITKELRCPICERIFYFTRKIPVGPTPKYCSEECKRKRNTQRVLEKYYKEKNPDPFYTEVRMKMYKMRHEPCIRCGFSDAVVLHDIIPAAEGGDRHDPDNRIPLCPNCHATLHKNLWSIWEVEDKLENNPSYNTQYWTTQLLKSYSYGMKEKYKPVS